MHFHGTDWIVESAAKRNGTVVVSVNAGAGSARYAKLLEDKVQFARWIQDAEEFTGRRFRHIYLTSWSAGYGVIREILKTDANRIDGVLLIDGLHAPYRNGTPGPLESDLVTEPLDMFESYAREAVAGRKRMFIVHSEIFPGTFASTTETADYLLGKLGLSRHAVLKWGPMGTQQLSEVRRGHFRVGGFAGNSAPDHVDLLHSLPEFAHWLF